MSVLPANTSALPPVEALFYAGWLKGNYRDSPTAGAAHLLAANAAYVGAWEDVSGYCEFRLLSYALGNGSAVGGVLIQWSMDGTNIDATEAAATALVGVVYDSGIIAYHMPFVRVRYTNGAVNAQTQFKLRMVVSPTAVGGGGGGAPIIGIVGQGAPGPVALAWPVELTAPQWSTPSPDPSSIAGSLAAGKLDPDRALVTRSHILTDETAFSDDFNDSGVVPGLQRALTGANVTMTLGSRAVTGVGTAFTTEVRVGDYVALNADYGASVTHNWAQVASIESNLAMTLVANYTGAGGTGAASVQNWAEQTQDVLGTGIVIAPGTSVLDMEAGALNGTVVYLLRNLAVGGRKGFMPFLVSWRARVAEKAANRIAFVGLTNAATAATSQQAAFTIEGAAGTENIVRCVTRTLGTGAGANDSYVTLANGGSVIDYHLYAMRVYPDRVDFFIDGALVFTSEWHLFDPYTNLLLCVGLTNDGVPAGNPHFFMEQIILKNLDDVTVEAQQTNPAKLTAATAIRQSLPAPNPSAILGLPGKSLQVEPDGALRTRARVLTDEGSFADDFTGASLLTALAGTCSFTNGSTTVTGSGTAFTTAIRAGQYVKADAHAAAAWAQVASIESDAALTLRNGYGGATVAGAASSVQNYAQEITPGGGGTAAAIAVALSRIDLTSGDGNPTLARISRRLASGAGRKGTAPLYVSFYAQLTNRRANQNSRMEIDTAIGGSAHSVRVEFAGGGAVGQVICSSYGGLGGNDVQTTYAAIPAGGTSADQHFYEVLIGLTQIDWWIDGWHAASHPYHLGDPYDDWIVNLEISNTGAVAGSTDFRIDNLVISDFDEVRSLSYQPDASKLNATVKDATVFAGSYVPPAVVAVADNLAHQVCTAMEVGRGYAITQIGGAALQALIVQPGGGAPGVGTIRLSPHFLFNGIEWVFRCRVAGEQLYVAKAVDGTANADVYHDSIDGGNGA